MTRILHKTFDGAIRVMQLNKESIAKPHTHEFLELVYIANGTATHTIDGISGVLQAGDYFVIDYSTTHEYFSEKGDLTVINCLFIPELLDKTFSGVKSFNDLAERYFFRITGRKIKGPASNQVFSDDGAVGILFQKMLEEYNEKNDGYTEMLRCMLGEIIIRTIRRIGSDDAVSDVTAHILEQIQKKYMQPLNLEALCRELHYSLPYISAKFKAETGITFTAALQNKRIEESCRLLCESTLCVADIAEKVGYSSIKFFNKIFRQITKMTPREYRKQSKA